MKKGEWYKDIPVVPVSYDEALAMEACGVLVLVSTPRLDDLGMYYTTKDVASHITARLFFIAAQGDEQHA